MTHLFVLETPIQMYVADNVIYAHSSTETSVSTNLEFQRPWLQLYSCYLPGQKVCVAPQMSGSEEMPEYLY